MPKTTLRILAAALLLADPVGLRAAEDPPAPAPIAVPAHADPEIDALLDRLEGADVDLDAFTARIVHRTDDELLGESVLRTGRLLYARFGAGGERALGFLFEATITDGRRREDRRRYVFRGPWLVEVDPERKLFIKRQIADPGRPFDPMRLGEGPFPLPIGQPKSEVLRRFEVSRAVLPTEGVLARLAERGPVEGLRLVPREGEPTGDQFRSLEFFIDRATSLPVGVAVTERDGDRQSARLDELVRNPELAPDDLSALDVALPDPREWTIDLRER